MHAFKLGDVIAQKYVLGEKIGEGGFAEVFEATAVETGDKVALKVLRSEHTNNPEAIARFQQEGSITSLLSHPHIAHTIECFSLRDGSRFMVMELLKGQDLANFLQAGGRLAPAACVELIRQVGEALSAAHELGFIHRDLKPENVFIVELPDATKGRPGLFKILDFGATRNLGGSFGLTARGFAIGTPEFMAPEHATGDSEAVDHRSDQFSLAVLAFYLFTGRVPFEGKNAVSVMLKVANDPPPKFSDLGVDLPAGVEQAVRKALSKDPQSRFENVAALVEALVKWLPPLQNADVTTVMPPPPAPHRRGLYIALAALCFAIGLACFWVLSRSPGMVAPATSDSPAANGR